jgi:hypothetical protein
MNKKLNTTLFFIVASLAHLLIVGVIATALFVVWVLAFLRWVPGPTTLLALVVILVAALVGSFPIYRRLVQWFQKKVDMDKYFDPIVKLPTRRSTR